MSSLHIDERKISRFPRMLLTVVFLLAILPAVNALPEKKAVLRKDTVSMSAHEPAKDKQEKVYQDKYWRYDRDKTKTKDEPNLFDRLWNDLMENLEKSIMSGNQDGSPNFWGIFWLLIFVALIVIVVLKVTNSGVNTIFSGKKRKAETTDATLEDVDIHAIDYEKMIADAIAAKDYRLGVRLWFLRVLKNLSDHELLHWKIDKTNSDYYYELGGTSLQEEFGNVSNVYDYIWYGEFPVDESSYRSAEEKFRHFLPRAEKQ